MSSPTNRTQLLALVKEANKDRPKGKKIAVVGRSNESIAKDLGISLKDQAKKAAAGLMDDLDKAGDVAQTMAKKLGVKGKAVEPAAQKIETAIAKSQKALAPNATTAQKHDAAVKAAKKAAIAIKKEVAAPPPPPKAEPKKVPITKTVPTAPARKPEATGEQARAALAKLEAKHSELLSQINQAKEQALTQTKAIAAKKGSKAAKEYYSEQVEQIKTKHTALQEKVLKKAREVLYVQNPSKMKISTAGEFDPETRSSTGKRIPPERAKVYAEGIAEFRKLVGVTSLDDKTLAVAAIVDHTGKKDRSYYGGKSDRIHMGTKADKVVVIHEAAHWLEEKDPNVHKKVQAFLEKRTKGEDWQKLKDLTGNPNYRDTEVAKPDKFMRPYMGKQTGPDNSEILSMGLEHMYRDPIGFAKQDPEYFDFIYNLMRGK